MKRFLLILLSVMLLLSMVSMVSCGGSVESESEKETDALDTDQPETAPQGGYDASFDRSTVKDNVPTDLKFTGETITFFTRDDQDLWKYEMDVDTIMNETLYDAIYYRNQTVEERLGVTIATVSQRGDFSNRLAWNDTLRTAVNTRSGDFDAAAIYLSTGSALAVEGMYYNVIDFPYIELDKPWWNQNLREELTLFDTLYYLAGDIAITETTQAFTMFYNKNLFDKYYGAEGINLYEVVDDKEWTIGYLYDLVAPVHEDLNSNGAVDDGDVVGFKSKAGETQQSNNDGWVAAFGINITTMVNGVPELSFYSERTVRAFEKLRALCLECPGTLIFDQAGETSFANGNLMFHFGSLNGGSGFREMTDLYGVLPTPMLEENQEGGYATTAGNVASLVTILSSLPADRKELVGATLELMAAESYKQVSPAYFEIALKTKYADDSEDSAMYDLILNSIRFSFGYCYSTESLKGGSGSLPIGSLFRLLSDDLAQEYESNQDVYNDNLQWLIDGLEEAAYSARSN